MSIAKRRFCSTASPVSTRISRFRSRAWSDVAQGRSEEGSGVAETLDWAATLAGLEVKDLHDDPEIVYATLIALLKTREDRASISKETTSRLVGQLA